MSNPRFLSTGLAKPGQMTIAEAIEAARARLSEYAERYYRHTRLAQDVHLVLMGEKAAQDHAATLAPQLERMIDRYNEQSKRVAELEASNRALASIAGLRAVRRAS